jgi:hypothetical protein
LFLQMHRERRAALDSSVKLQAWGRDFRDAAAREQEERVLFDRELFYAVQSRERLTTMIEKYADAFAVTG